jgi:hypothetical protein
VLAFGQVEAALQNWMRASSRRRSMCVACWWKPVDPISTGPGVGPELATRRTGSPQPSSQSPTRPSSGSVDDFRRLTAEHNPAPKVAVAVARSRASSWRPCRHRRSQSDSPVVHQGV